MRRPASPWRAIVAWRGDAGPPGQSGAHICPTVGDTTWVSIDDHPPRAWTEADLQELCAECRRETQSLEFKGELELDTPGEKNDLVVVPDSVVHPGLLGGWVVSKPPVPRRTPDEGSR